MVDARDLLVYQVLLRDRAALADLVESTLAPLRAARGGAAPLLETLAAYFDAGGNAAPRRAHLHLSVRAVTYRLERVRDADRARPEPARGPVRAARRGARGPAAGLAHSRFTGLSSQIAGNPAMQPA